MRMKLTDKDIAVVETFSGWYVGPKWACGANTIITALQGEMTFNVMRLILNQNGWHHVDFAGFMEVDAKDKAFTEYSPELREFRVFLLSPGMRFHGKN